MLCEVASRDLKTGVYPLQDAFTGSSREEETDTNEIFDRLFFLMCQGLLKTPFLYQSLTPRFQSDASSIHPCFELRSETSLTEDIFKEVIPEEMLEFDIVVWMPPVREYTARVKIKSVEKATPRIVEPERF